VTEPLAPLAERLRPKRINDVVGQAHLLAPDKSLAVALAAQKAHSMILWGPPGVGKTTLARLLAEAFDVEMIAISAVLAGVKDIRDAVAQAQISRTERNRATLLFVDEVHRFNKSQQDAFLPYVESGLLTFIGATTENPSFEVNKALLSRAQVYVLEPLEAADLQLLIARGLIEMNAAYTLDPKVVELLCDFADGDARRLLNTLEQLDAAARSKSLTSVSEDLAKAVLTRALRRFDAGGEHFYDSISALHKSVRGSNPDAALYWLVRMLDGGTDPLYLGRRLIRMAAEDIGLADPRALEITLNAVQTYERLGSPEGELALAQATVYLAIAAKSNAVYNAYNAVRKFIAHDASRPIPLHLRNAPTKLMKDLDYGKAYRYAHDEPDAYAAGETYLPQGLERQQWYHPTDRGLERKIQEKLAYLRGLDAAQHQS
jgi:putative ATPase